MGNPDLLVILNLRDETRLCRERMMAQYFRFVHNKTRARVSFRSIAHRKPPLYRFKMVQRVFRFVHDEIRLCR